METVTIRVTEASRNFADCVNRVRYQGATFILKKNGTAVARMVPTMQKPERGQEVAVALRKATEDVHPGKEEATSWLHDLEQARGAMAPHGKPWRS